ncbi:MAG: hypothetical protein OEM81_04635 [Acidimicrobiia bacterium]|nr:hypothetical protein [Acidimicrobiia bacterium]MDH5615338.1 hypothetical protein [Acidimicrobiia bacterium]
MTTMQRFGTLVLALALVTAACNRGDDAELTTTTAPGSQTTTTTAVTTTGDGTGETTTTLEGATGTPGYDIIAGDSEAGEYVVLVEPGTYTERDLQNIMEDLVDEYAPVTVHLIDTEDAGDLVLKDELTEAEQAVLNAHYFARIVEGTTLEFLGPYGDLESVHIGS